MSKLEGYTPGPWVLNGTGVVFGEGTVEGVVAKTHDNSWGRDCLPGDVTQANARLIAAAPLLYETLRDLIGALQQNGQWDDAMSAACKLGADSELYAASVLIDQIDNDLL